MTRTLKLEDIPSIIADRNRYERILYTSPREAYRELRRRRRDPRLARAVLEFLDGDVLEPLRKRPRAVITRSVVSPNFEVRRFDRLVRAHGTLRPLYLEYHKDLFTPNNPSKHMLGRLFFFNGRGKKGGVKLNSLNVVDFSHANGRSFSSVTTLSGQKFIEFHHEFFDARHRRLSHTFVDASRWLSAHGSSAGAYYPAFLALFIRHGILFENVLLNKQESDFVAQVFLPTFLSLYHRFGLKPLIAPLTPTDTEDDRYWMYYPGTDMQYVAAKTQRVA